MKNIRSAVKSFLADHAGLSVQRLDNIGFGADLRDDLLHYLGPGRHLVIDVGANEGQTATWLLERFPDAEIHSFEPVPATYEVLQRTVAGTGVRTVNSAVGASCGQETMYVSGTSGTNSLHGKSGEPTQVEVTTLDTYAGDSVSRQIDLLKIDTEGHEVAVLEGAEGLLSSGRISHVLAECEFERGPHEPHGDFTEIFALLRGHGYNVVAFYCQGVDDLGWRWGNVLFRRVTPEMVAGQRQADFAMSPFAARS
jgi:FkbM family methyltransferase